MLNGYGLQLLQGAMVTIAVSISALLVGLTLSIVGAAGELSVYRAIRWFSGSFFALVRGLPELLVLFTIYFGGTILLTHLWGHNVEISGFIAGVLGLGLIFAAYGSQTIRGAFLAIPRGQQESAKALGLPAWRIFQRILLPQAWRYALPGLSNLWLVLLKDSALVSLLGLAEIMNKAQVAASTTHQPFKFYLFAAALFLCLTSLSQLLINRFNQQRCEAI